MSFDVFLQRFSAGEPAEAHRQPVLEILRAANHRRPGDFGCYIVWFTDGTDVEFSATELETEAPFTACAFHIRAFGDEMAKFIYDVAKAGDMVIIPAMDGAPVALLSAAQAEHLPEEIRESFHPVLIESATELAILLRGGVADWSSYRDQVVRREDERPKRH